MSKKRQAFHLVGLAFAVLLVAACGSAATVPTAIPTDVLVPATAATSPTTAAGASGQSAVSDAARIQFEPNATSWSTTGELPVNTVLRFVLSAQAGQPMTVKLTTEPEPDAGPAATIHVSGADGQVLTPEVTTNWTGVLPASQDYSIEVRSVTQETVSYTLLVAIPVGGSTPYVPVTPEVCATIQELAAQATGVTFTMEADAPFTDPRTGEMGRGCTLTATGTGADFDNPSVVMLSLVNGMLGWTEQMDYQASGPTGEMTGLTRDMALMLVDVGWEPSPDAQCPSDQPISACDLKPEQRLYTVQIQTAMK